MHAGNTEQSITQGPSVFITSYLEFRFRLFWKYIYRVALGLTFS